MVSMRQTPIYSARVQTRIFSFFYVSKNKAFRWDPQYVILNCSLTLTRLQDQFEETENYIRLSDDNIRNTFENGTENLLTPIFESLEPTTASLQSFRDSLVEKIFTNENTFDSISNDVNLVASQLTSGRSETLSVLINNNCKIWVHISENIDKYENTLEWSIEGGFNNLLPNSR